MTPRTLHLTSLLLLVLLLVGSVIAYPTLPERIPAHFDLSGRADGWSEVSWSSWFMLPLIAVFTYLVIVGSVWYLRAHPERMNVPSRKKFSAMAPDDQRAIMEIGEAFLHATNGVLMLLFAALVWGTWVAAQGTGRLPGLALFILYVVSLGGILVGPFFAWYLYTKADRLYRAGVTKANA